MTVRILHNPQCTKSRGTLALIQQRGIDAEVVLYLETPPTSQELRSILSKLGMTARELMRKGEEQYTSLGLENPGLSEDQLIEAMVSHPRLIERPIVIIGDKAAIGRPPENVLGILNALAK